MKLLTHQEIRSALEVELKLVKVGRIWLFDSEYCGLSKAEFDNLLKDIEPIELQFKAEIFDCEDFAHVLSAFVKLTAANKYPKGVAFGEITTRHSISKEIHTLNFLITDTSEALYFEPQGKIFVNGENYEPFYARI